MCPPAYTIAIRMAPIAKGARGLPLRTAVPIVKTRNMVPSPRPRISSWLYARRAWRSVCVKQAWLKGRWEWWCPTRIGNRACTHVPCSTGSNSTVPPSVSIRARCDATPTDVSLAEPLRDDRGVHAHSVVAHIQSHRIASVGQLRLNPVSVCVTGDVVEQFTCHAVQRHVVRMAPRILDRTLDGHAGALREAVGTT